MRLYHKFLNQLSTIDLLVHPTQHPNHIRFIKLRCPCQQHSQSPMRPTPPMAVPSVNAVNPKFPCERIYLSADAVAAEMDTGVARCLVVGRAMIWEIWRMPWVFIILFPFVSNQKGSQTSSMSLEVLSGMAFRILRPLPPIGRRILKCVRACLPLQLRQ